MPDVVVRLQTQDGTWEVAGVDRKSGIVPEHVKYSADQNGSTTAGFDLRRDVGSFWPDLAAFTPVEIEVDSVLVWSGRIKETPTHETASDSVINVQCEGWQYHLDDDVYQKDYVRTKLSDWQDYRSLLNANLTAWPSSMLVNNGSGTIVIGAANGTTWITGTAAGILLDMGPTDLAKRIVVAGYRTAGTGASGIYARAGNNVNGILAGTGATDAFSGVALSSISTTAPDGSVLSGTFPTAARYVSLFVYNGSVTYTAGPADGNGDVFIVTGIQVFTSTAYEGADTSVLRASTVVSDATGLTPLLSTDTSQITTTSFFIPDFGVRTPQTPREVQDAVNSFHNYVRKVDVLKRLVFKPKPSVAILAAGESSNIEIEDASANSGDEIYNRALVTANYADGSPLFVTVSAAQLSSLARAIASPAPTNPSADTNSTGWTTKAGSATRDTSVFDTGPASFKSNGTSPTFLLGTFTGTFRRGVTYLLTFSVRVNGDRGGVAYSFGDLTNGDYTSSFYGTGYLAINTWKSMSIAWTPSADTSSVSFQALQQGGGFGGGGTLITTIWIDTLALQQGVPTIPDRRGFLRTKHLPLEFPATDATATQIASIYLQDHIRTPFKGSVVAHGNDAITGVLDGKPVSLWTLPSYTTEMLRLNNRIDPDTGAIGRDGRIAQVDVDVDTATATIALDSTRSNFEAYLARLALVTNSRLGS